MKKIKTIIFVMMIIILSSVVYADFVNDAISYFNFNQTGTTPLIDLVDGDSNSTYDIGWVKGSTGIIGSAWCNSTWQGKQIIKIPASDIHFNGAWTHSFWVYDYTSTYANSDATYYSIGAGSGARTRAGLWSGTSPTKYYAIDGVGTTDMPNTAREQAFYMITVTYNGINNLSYYENKTFKYSYDVGVLALANTNGINFGAASFWVINKSMDVCFDELKLFNRSLTIAEITSIYDNESLGISYPYNFTTPPTPPLNYSNFISFLSQIPTNLTATTTFNQVVNITYNFSSTDLISAKLNYSISGGSSCLQLINGSCVYTNNTYNLKNNNSVNGINHSFILTENELYPSNNLLNYTAFNSSHSVYNLANDKRFLSVRYTNFTSARYNLLEIMGLSSGNAKVYACNSSYAYDTQILTSSNCLEIGSLTNLITYNHTHNVYSSYNIIPFTINNGKFGLSNVAVTNNVTFIFSGSATGTTNISYINTETRPDTTQTSNNGLVWSSQTYTPDTHLHFYTGNEYLNYQAVGNYGSDNITILRSELIDLTPFAPAPPIITQPFDSVQASKFLNITWLNATPFLNPITFYNLTLRNNDSTLNRQITTTSNATNFYNYDLYSENLTIGVYKVRVEATDTLGAKSYDEETFNLTTNMVFNISVLSYNGGFVTAYNISTTNLDNGQTSQSNSSNGNLTLNLVRGGNYSLLFDSSSFALSTFNITFNDSVYQYQNFTIYTTNSVYINVFDEDTFTRVMENVTIVVTGSSETTFYTANGVKYIDNLTDGSYIIKLSSANYSLKSYSLTVENRSTQTLNAYLVRTPSYTIITVTNYNTGIALENVALSIEKILNGTYTVVDSKLTDITGKTQIGYTALVAYRFTLTKTGFTTKQFTLNPILFSAYSVALNPTSIQNNNYDYDLISITYYPKTFNNNENNDFTYIINAPSGNLENYSVQLSYKDLTTYYSGVNAYGDTITLNLTVMDANLFDRVYLNYSYTTTQSGLKTFSQTIDLLGLNSTGNYTVGTLKRDLDKYGLGIFEKMFIATLGIIILSGFGYAILGLGGALVLMMFSQGIAVYLGFLPLSSIVLSILVGIALLITTNKGGGSG